MKMHRIDSICFMCLEQKSSSHFLHVENAFIIELYEKCRNIYRLKTLKHDDKKEDEEEPFDCDCDSIPNYFRNITKFLTNPVFNHLRDSTKFLKEKNLICFDCFLKGTKHEDLREAKKEKKNTTSRSQIPGGGGSVSNFSRTELSESRFKIRSGAGFAKNGPNKHRFFLNPDASKTVQRVKYSLRHPETDDSSVDKTTQTQTQRSLKPSSYRLNTPNQTSSASLQSMAETQKSTIFKTLLMKHLKSNNQLSRLILPENKEIKETNFSALKPPQIQVLKDTSSFPFSSSLQEKLKIQSKSNNLKNDTNIAKNSKYAKKCSKSSQKGQKGLKLPQNGPNIQKNQNIEIEGLSNFKDEKLVRERIYGYAYENNFKE